MSMRERATRYAIEKLLDAAAVIGLVALVWLLTAMAFGFDPVQP